MLYIKTPLRISFSGGMTDFPQFFNQYGGSVISVTIDSYVNLFLNKKFEAGIRLMYSKTENVKNINNIQHNLFRETLKHFKTNNIEIASIADVPSSGTGLGSSAAFLVGLIRLIYYYNNSSDFKNKKNLANFAYHIENNKSKMSGGLQDHYAASFCGLNHFKFTKKNTYIKKIKLEKSFLEDFQNSLGLFYLDKTGRSQNITKKNINLINKKNNKDYLFKILSLTKELNNSFKKPEIKKIAEIISEGWNIKKSYQKSFIDYSYQDTFLNKAIKMGAYGGKLLGAGDRGFFLTIGPKKVLQRIKDEFKLKTIFPRFVLNSQNIKEF